MFYLFLVASFIAVNIITTIIIGQRIINKIRSLFSIFCLVDARKSLAMSIKNISAIPISRYLSIGIAIILLQVYLFERLDLV